MASLKDKTVYLDTNILIYLLEDYPHYQQNLDRLLGLIESQDISVHTSQLSLAEALVKPLRDQNKEVVAGYEGLFSATSFLTIHRIDLDVLVRAAEIRSRTPHKLPDAIHIATAENFGCDVFMTNDGNIREIKGVQVIGLSDL